MIVIIVVVVAVAITALIVLVMVMTLNDDSKHPPGDEDRRHRVRRRAHLPRWPFN